MHIHTDAQLSVVPATAKILLVFLYYLAHCLLFYVHSSQYIYIVLIYLICFLVANVIISNMATRSNKPSDRMKTYIQQSTAN